MKRITKKVRDEAALICAIAACEPPALIDAVDEGLSVSEVATFIETSYDAVALALNAQSFVYGHTSHSYEASCAEAEALLRTGWRP